MSLVTIAIAVSRVEAAVLAGMLEGYGIPVHIGGYAQGTLEYNSLALGGYRLWVAEADWAAASDILEQAGANAPGTFCTGPRRAILRFFGAVLGIHAAFLLPGAALGVLSADLLLFPVTMMFVPVNPQGRADFYFAPRSGGA